MFIISLIPLMFITVNSYSLLTFKSTIHRIQRSVSVFAESSQNIQISNNPQIIKLQYSQSHSQRVRSNDEETEEDEDDGEDQIEVPVQISQETSDAPQAEQISLLKQGLNISTFLNGSDVRVGILMARWNADIISGLYKVKTYRMR